MNNNMAERNSNRLERSNSNSFDLTLVLESFTKCSENINALSMDHYLTAFKELYGFFSILGTVFGFVASEINSKVAILEKYRQSDNAPEYATIHSMLEFENSNGIIQETTNPSGSRTLLRLHRALEFIISFMRELSTASANAKSSTIAQECYRNTLSQYHPWLIQKGAYLAMYTLPARQQFMERVSGGPCDQTMVEYYEKLLGDISEVSQKVYDATQALYEEHSLLNLP